MLIFGELKREKKRDILRTKGSEGEVKRKGSGGV